MSRSAPTLSAASQITSRGSPLSTSVSTATCGCSAQRRLALSTAAAETARGVIIGASRDFIPTYQPAEVRERVLLRMVRSQAGILAAQSEAARRAGMGGETAGHL